MTISKAIKPTTNNQRKEINMSNFTLNTVLDSIKSDIEDVLNQLDQNEINELTSGDVCNLLDNNHYYAPEVIYTCDAWEIVAGSSFNDYAVENLDFSNCDRSADCVMKEAQAKINAAYYLKRQAIAEEVLENLQDE